MRIPSAASMRMTSRLMILSTMSVVLVLAMVTLLIAGQSQGQDPPKKDPPPQPLDMVKLEASYDAELLPIFEDSCAECHDSGEAERELNLMEFTGLLAGSINGAIFEPGKPEESRLFKVIQDGHDPHMPPDGQLSDDDIAQIKTWISGLPAALKPKLGKKKDDGDPANAQR